MDVISISVQSSSSRLGWTASFHVPPQNETTPQTPPASSSASSPYDLSPIELVFFSVICGLTLLTAVIGNSLVIWIIMRRVRQSNTNLFIINLALVDLFLMIFNMPWTFIYSMNGNIWLWGSVWCKLVWSIGMVAMSANAFTFTAIMVDRYQAIADPLHKYVERRRRAIIALIVIWLLAFLTCLPTLIGYDEGLTTDNNTTGGKRMLCKYSWTDHDEFIHMVVLAIVQYVIPLALTMIAYWLIRRKIGKSEAIGESSTAEAMAIKTKRKVVSMMMVVVVTFSICVFPNTVFSLMYYWDVVRNQVDGRVIIRVFLAVYWLQISNSMWNPFIYAYWNTTFRLGIKYAFRWLPFVKWDDAVDGPKFFDQRRTFSTAYRPSNNRRQQLAEAIPVMGFILQRPADGAAPPDATDRAILYNANNV